MKTFKMILFTMMMVSLMVGSIALAQPPMGEKPGSTMDEETGAGTEKHMRPEPRGPLGQLMKFQHQNITVTVLAELSGLDADSIDAELELRHPSEILSTYDIEMETFITAMDVQTTALVEAALAAGSITADQGDGIITMIKNKPERPESEEEQEEEGETPPRFKYTD